MGNSKAKFSRKQLKCLISIMMSLGLVMSLVMIPAKKVEANSGSITSIYLSYDMNEADLNTAWMEYEVSSRFKDSGKNGVDTSLYTYSPEYSYLATKEADGTFNNLYVSSNYVSEGKQYYYALSVFLHGNSIKNKTTEYYKGTPKSLGTYDLMIDDDNNGSFHNKSAGAYLLISDDNSMATFFIPADSVSTASRITHIAIYPNKNVSMNKGEQRSFNATVMGTSDNKMAFWSISGNNSSNTTVFQYDTSNALVTIGADETASEITLKAYSGFDSSVFQTIKIRVGSSSEISRVDINFDEDIIYLAPGVTEGEVSQRVYTASSASGTGCYLDTQSNMGILFDYLGAPKGELNGQLYGISDGSGLVQADKDYYLYYSVYHELGYKWPDSIIKNGQNVKSIKDFPELSVYTNGVLSTNVYVSYNNSHENIWIYIPIDMWKENIAKHSDKLTISGITDKTYTGSAITQTLSVSYNGKTLTEGTDYTVTYSNNTNVGTANVIVTGIGAYKGSVTKTFKINAAAGQSSGGSTGATTPKYSNEWVNGKWYNADGTQTYEGILEWKCNSTGWWVEDSSGWYPVSQWQKIDGKWYYFLDTGYMDYSEYRDGYWLGSDGAMVDGYYGEWKSDSTGWWFEDTSGWYPQSQWLWIDGKCYYFGADGYWDGSVA